MWPRKRGMRDRYGYSFYERSESIRQFTVVFLHGTNMEWMKYVWGCACFKTAFVVPIAVIINQYSGGFQQFGSAMYTLLYMLILFSTDNLMN